MALSAIPPKQGSVTGTGYYVGGLVGANDYNGTINNSYSTGSVSGGGYVGGLVGYNDGTISNSYSTGSVSGGGYILAASWGIMIIMAPSTIPTTARGR